MAIKNTAVHLIGIDNENVLSLRNLQDMDRIIERIDGKKKVAVIGGGFIGLEVAEALRELGIGATLIELAVRHGPLQDHERLLRHQPVRLSPIFYPGLRGKSFSTGCATTVLRIIWQRMG